MKNIISASRRTDLPRWFLKPTIEAFKKESITLMNPFNNIPYSVSLRPDDIHSIVWWSKDYKKFVESNNIEFFSRYNNFFQFTLNGYSQEKMQSFLEGGITSSLDERIAQMKILVDTFSPLQVTWRFDPIIVWKENTSIPDIESFLQIEGEGLTYLAEQYLRDFEYLSGRIGKMGVSRCVISFVQYYGKVLSRLNRKFKENLGPFRDPPLEEKIEIARRLAIINKKNGIETFSCANDSIVDGKLIQKSHCIDGDLLEKLFSERASKSKDKGQRLECGCTNSRDIGAYNQKCQHSCLYCYGN